MEEQANNEAGGSAPEPRGNRGWFQRGGDPRINRDGRKRLAWAACADRAPFAGQLMLLRVPTRDFLRRLSGAGDPGITNLPADCEAVAGRVDAERDAFALVIRSASFPRIAKGAPLPEFVPEAAPPADRAPCDGPLMLLFVPARNLSTRLTSPRGGWMTNLPPGFEYVDCRVDPARKGILFTIRSERFTEIARGAIVPEFAPQFFGEPWR